MSIQVQFKLDSFNKGPRSTHPGHESLSLQGVGHLAVLVVQVLGASSFVQLRLSVTGDADRRNIAD